MNKTIKKIPASISEYVQEHFREDFLFEVRDVKEMEGGHFIYTIEVTKDDYIHTLVFDENGEIVKKDADQAFPPDDHDEPAVGDMPE